VFGQHTYCHIFRSSRYPFEFNQFHTLQCHNSSLSRVLLEICFFCFVASALLRARSFKYLRMDCASRLKSQESCKVRHKGRLIRRRLTRNRNRRTGQATLHVISLRSSPTHLTPSGAITIPALTGRRTTITPLCYLPDRPSRDTPNIRVRREQGALVIPHRQHLLQWHSQFSLYWHVLHRIRQPHPRHDRPMPS